MKAKDLQWCTIAVTMFVGWSAHAQVPSLVKVEGDWIPSSAVSLPDEVSPPGVPGVNLEVAGFRGIFAVPIKLSDNAVLLPGGGYDYQFADQSFSRLGVPRQLGLHVVNFSVNFIYKLSDNWSILLRASPALAGDFVSVDSDHFRIEGGALASYKFSDRFTLGGGLVGTYRFGELLPVPSIQLDWRISDSLRLNALLPALLNFIWKPSDRVELGLSATIRGNSYSLTSQSVTGRWPCAAQADNNPLTPFNETEASPERCFSNLAYSTGEIGPVAAVRLGASLWLSVRAGFVFFRRYEFLNANNDTPDIGDLEVDRNITIRAGLEFRIPQRD